MSTSKKNLYTVSLAVSLIGVLLLLTENFGAWQDRSSFFGVVEGYVWIGSEKAFPWAQIGILALSACLLFTAYTSFKGYTRPENVSPELLHLGYRVSMLEVGLTGVFALGFVLMVMDSDWWWLDTGFYGALVAGAVNLWIYGQLR
ncbi:MAG: hypothetical protein V1924_06255 [Candidatus Bathyarchaeota archaeon]